MSVKFFNLSFPPHQLSCFLQSASCIWFWKCWKQSYLEVDDLLFIHATYAFYLSSVIFVMLSSVSSNQPWWSLIFSSKCWLCWFPHQILNWSYFCAVFPVRGPWDVSFSSWLAANCSWCLLYLSFSVLNEGQMSFGFLWSFGAVCSNSKVLASLWSVQHSSPTMAVVILNLLVPCLWQIMRTQTFHALKIIFLFNAVQLLYMYLPVIVYWPVWSGQARFGDLY